MTNKSLASSQLQLEMHIKVILICLFVFFQFYELSCNYWNSSDNKNHIQILFLNEIMKKMRFTKEAGIFDSKSIVRKFEKDEGPWKSKYEVDATNVVVNKAYGECPGHDKNWVRVYGMHSCYTSDGCSKPQSVTAFMSSGLSKKSLKPVEWIPANCN